MIPFRRYLLKVGLLLHWVFTSLNAECPRQRVLTGISCPNSQLLAIFGLWNKQIAGLIRGDIRIFGEFIFIYL